MSFKDWGVRHEPTRAPDLTERFDPYWGRPLDGLDEVPLSARRQMETETSRVPDEGIVQDIKMMAMFRHHLRDWLMIILCIILDVILNVIHPYYRFVGTFTDPVMFPLKSNTVPLWSVPLIALGIPITVFIGYYIKRRDSRDLHQAVLGLLTAVAITAVITDAIKDGVGRARPDFFYRCFPDGIADINQQTQEYICHGDAATIREGHKSFPSGHSSWSFSGLGYLSFYLAGKVTFFDRRGFTSRILIVFFPLLLAALVAVSRVSDYWHHWQDVTVGGLLGFTIAYFSYKQHFPDFSDKMAALPYPHVIRSSPLPVTSRNNNSASWETSTPGPARATNIASWGTSATAPARATNAAYDMEAAEV